jgi:DNA-binding MarR family transcriptional regulator
MEVMFDLMRLTSRLSRDFERVHRPRGWTWAGFRIANLLWVFGSLEPGELARLSGASRASISSALKTLEARGHISRSTRPTDRRHVEVTLTGAGHTALNQAIAEQAERERAWLDLLSNDERATLGKLVARLVEQPRPERLLR